MCSERDSDFGRHMSRAPGRTATRAAPQPAVLQYIIRQLFFTESVMVNLMPPLCSQYNICSHNYNVKRTGTHWGDGVITQYHWSKHSCMTKWREVCVAEQVGESLTGADVPTYGSRPSFHDAISCTEKERERGGSCFFLRPRSIKRRPPSLSLPPAQ